MPAEKARKFSSLALQRLAGRSGAIAAAIGVSEATISRWKSEGDLDRACLILAHAGLKVVPMELRCFPEEEANALLTLARSRLDSVRTVSDLWADEPE